jgi:hypothetical protein
MTGGEVETQDQCWNGAERPEFKDIKFFVKIIENFDLKGEEAVQKVCN